MRLRIVYYIFYMNKHTFITSDLRVHVMAKSNAIFLAISPLMQDEKHAKLMSPTIHNVFWYTVIIYAVGLL